VNRSVRSGWGHSAARCDSVPHLLLGSARLTPFAKPREGDPIIVFSRALAPADLAGTVTCSRDRAKEMAQRHNESAHHCDSHKPAATMKPNSDTSCMSTQLLTDDGFGTSVAGDPVVAQPNSPENALHAAGAGWSPYEVWCTQVRAVQAARPSNMRTLSPAATYERRSNPRNASLSEAARNIAHIFARVVTSLKVRWVLESIGHRRP
jgi:hypothetical protein